MSIEDKITNLEEELQKLKAICTEESVPKMIQIPNREYRLAETPVTVAQYRTYCLATGVAMPKQPKPYNDANPVTNVNWHDANRYCEWLSKKSGDNYRLPTEDEFEYCCANCTNGTSETAVFGQRYISQVKTKIQNEFGLYDMLGLVWEWQQ